jgi:hypothetical protein
LLGIGSVVIRSVVRGERVCIANRGNGQRVSVVGGLEPLPLIQLLDTVDVDMSSLLNFDESVIVSTAEIQTDSVFTVDGDSQSPNRNSCLDFYANKCIQTVRRMHLVEAESQTESFLGAYGERK